MRKFLASAAMIGLMAGLPPAFAQDREHHDRGGGQPQNEQHGGDQRGGERHGGGEPHGGPPPAMQARPDQGEMRGRERGPDNAMRGPREERFNRSPPNMTAQPNHAPQNPPANAMRGPERRFGQGNERRGERRDFSGVRNFHQNFRAERRFRAAPYRQPRGFYVHRWSWGETLPSLFWARPYWILDFEDYDLPPPPFGAVWVRVGDDALLIDQYDGMIIEVDYGVFY